MIFSVRLDSVVSTEALRERFVSYFATSRTHVISTPNPEILLCARTDKGYASLLNGADLSLPDGFGLSSLVLLKTGKRIRRFPGIDTAEMLIDVAAQHGTSILLLGGEHGNAIRAAEHFTKKRPSLRIITAGDNIAIGANGLAISEEHERRIGDLIRQASPNIIFVGLGAPKQEQWIAAHRKLFPSVRIIMTVGGAFDIWSGRFRRAPKIIRHAGLEWLWRFIQQPSRFPRIIRATLVFPWYAIIEKPRR